MSAMGDTTQSSSQLIATTNLVVPATSQVAPTPTTYGSIVAGGSGDTEMEHATGNIVSLTNPVKAGSQGATRMDQAMADARFADSLHRNVLIYQQDVFTGVGTANFFPWQAWMGDFFVQDKLKNFNYVHGSLILSGIVVAPPLSSGLFVVTAVPRYEGIDYQPCPETHALMCPHVIVDLSTSSDFELTLPWVVSSDWGNLHDDLWSKYWVVTVRVLSPAVSAIADGCAASALRIFARPGLDFQLSGPQFQSGRRTGATMTTGTPSRSGFNTSRANPGVGSSQNSGGSLQKSVNAHAIGTTGKKYSEVAGSVASTAAMLAPIPVIGEAAAVVAGVAATAKSWLEWMGFTRETKVVIPQDCILKTTQNLVNCDGEDTSLISALFQENRLSIDPAINGALSSIDESSFGHIHSRFSYIGKLSYVVGDPNPSDFLIPITPCMGNFSAGDFEFTPTAAGYTAARFTYWRGDMKYIFYPVVSPVHRGKLQFVWQPVPDDSDINVDLTNLSINSIVDIGAAQPIEITVGYNNDNPACFTDFYAIDSALEVADYSTINGYLRIRSIVPIVGAQCGGNVDVLVFVAAGDNMQFALPTDTMIIEGVPKDFGVDVTINVPFQSGTVGAEGQQLISIALIPSSGDYAATEILWGEDVKSYRALIQKPSVCNVSELPEEKNYYILPHTPFAFDRPNNFLNYFGSTFLAFAGSIRYKALIDRESISVNNSDTFTLLGATPTFCNLLAAGGSLPLGQFNPAVTDAAIAVEVTCPYYHNEKWVPAYAPGAVNDVMFWSWYNEAVVDMILYRSAGPDARLTFYRGPNIFVFEVPQPEPLLFMQATFATATSGLAAKTVSPVPNKRASTSKKKNEITLNQYRARTGRSAFKTTGRLFKRPASDPVPVTETAPLLI